MGRKASKNPQGRTLIRFGHHPFALIFKCQLPKVNSPAPHIAADRRCRGGSSDHAFPPLWLYNCLISNFLQPMNLTETRQMTLSPNARICNRVDTARQFVVERLFSRGPLGPVPFTMWVYAKPLARRHYDCNCAVEYTVTAESVFQRTGRKSVSHFVCPCMGHFVE